MQSLSTCLVAAALFVAAVNAQFQINTPASLTQCVPTQFTWTGGQAPYFLAINPGGVPGAAALQQYSGLTGTSFSWTTNISAGTSIGLQLTDSAGQVAQSAPVTIQSGPSSSCLNGEQTSAASSGASTTGASTGNSGTSTTAPAASTTGTTKASTSGSSAGSASGSKTSASASSSSTAASGGNGALSNVASAGVVGIVGALAAALLA